MVAKITAKDGDLSIKFGGGLHTRASEDEIDPREASAGANFLLDLENRELRPRPPFDLIGQVPNGAEIRGGATLVKSDGTVSVLVQAGASVYEWDGETTFSKVGSCSASSKLRGHWRTHNWNLTDEVLLTDLNLADVVKKWDGTTFSSVVFTNSSASGASFGTFYAKYLSISDERAVFANVKDPSLATPHMIVGSLRSDYTQISVADRPSSALSEEDPFFLLTPDLKPINGQMEAFGTSIFSTENGRLFNLSGASAKDFSFSEFFAGSAATGPEALEYIGNDIIYGRQGRVESVRDTNAFGNSEADDLTKGISDAVGGFTGWRIVFNSRLNRVYLFPDGQSEAWVFNSAMRTIRSTADIGSLVSASSNKQNLSPWMKWTTTHSMAFQPTFVMSMLDPLDGLEYVFMGDALGNFYRMEGTGLAGDGGVASISTSWTTKLFAAPVGAEAHGLVGFLKYHKGLPISATLTFQFAGRTAFDDVRTITIPGLGGSNFFGGDAFFGGEVFFGAPFSNRLVMQEFMPAGQAEEFQIRIDIDSVNDFRINEIGLRFRIAS